MTGYFTEDNYANKCAVKLMPVAGNIFRVIIDIFYFYEIFLVLAFVYALSGF